MIRHGLSITRALRFGRSYLVYHFFTPFCCAAPGAQNRQRPDLLSRAQLISGNGHSGVGRLFVIMRAARVLFQIRGIPMATVGQARINRVVSDRTFAGLLG